VYSGRRLGTGVDNGAVGVSNACVSRTQASKAVRLISCCSWRSTTCQISRGAMGMVAADEAGDAVVGKVITQRSSHR